MRYNSLLAGFWLLGVGILSYSVTAFHRSIQLPVKWACFHSQILSWSLPGIPFRSRFSFLFLSKFLVGGFDIFPIKLLGVCPSFVCKSHVCRSVFILCIWLASRWLWLEGRPDLLVTVCRYPLFQGRTDMRGFCWLLESFIKDFAVISVVVTAFCVDVF